MRECDEWLLDRPETTMEMFRLTESSRADDKALRELNRRFPGYITFQQLREKYARFLFCSRDHTPVNMRRFHTTVKQARERARKAQQERGGNASDEVE